MTPFDRRHWIFDLDGTLTEPVHDFDAIRAMLAVPAGRGILEHLESLDAEQRTPLLDKLDAHEWNLAGRAVRAGGAVELLERLRVRRCRLGILTRNNRANVRRTLAAAGLGGYFDERYVRTRDDARPKPDADGIAQLLEAWAAEPADAVMVGDHAIDVEAGRRAGCTTVFVRSTSGEAPTPPADWVVDDLLALASRLPARPLPE